MEALANAPAWTALLLGLAALSVGVGALRQPGTWQTMVREIMESPTLQFLSGMLEMVVGAAVYFVNPWLPEDILACVMKALGGLMMMEALVILGFCDVYSQFWVKCLTHMHRGWSIFTTLVGAALVAAGMMSFH